MQDDKANTQLSATLERVVFHNDDNNFTVAKCNLEDGTEVTVVGTLIGVERGTPLLLSGTWVQDKRFGRQFRVDSYQVRSPQTLLGIERYLSSGLIPGIGEELAKRIVKAFGLNTFDVIANSPKELTQVGGIGEKRAESIAAAWIDQKQIQDVMVFLRGHGVSSSFAARIWKRYGADAINIVRANPYRLALDIWGIGFKSADQIAQNLGIAKDAGERIEAGLIHVLGQASEDGHVHVPQEHAIASATELLSIDAAPIPAAIDRLLVSHLVVRELLNHAPCLSLTSLRDHEVEAAELFCEIAQSAALDLHLDLDAFLESYQVRHELALAPQQRAAIQAGIRDKCVIITGGPGVGKTTIIRALVELYAGQDRQIALAAPTGRAAKRLAESTGMPASTLHRLLEFRPQTGGFERGMQNPIEADVVIVDEASMMDILLFHAFVAAIPAHANLILVGDVDQLPSVGPGSVLGDLIGSERATVVRLTEIFRQAAESQIVVNAHRVNKGELPDLRTPKGTDPGRSDFYFIERDEPTSALATLVDLVVDRIPERFGFDPLVDIQVLTPMHRGQLGTVSINAALQDALVDTQGPALTRGVRSYRVGDKVMQVRNNYDNDVFNGDVGIVREVQTKAGFMQVELLDGRMLRYERDALDDVIHAYAISVHKSQGSEYPCVVLPLLTQHYMMLQRNLLYTALTRGKELVVIIGAAKAVSMAVRNQDSRQRWTYLAERIQARMS